MSEIKEDPTIKEVLIDEWSIKEKLYLASAVERYGHEDWEFISSTLTEFLEPNRPLDWFSPSNCEIQYEFLINDYNKNNRSSESEIVDESIPSILPEEQKAELHEKSNEIHFVQSGEATDAVVQQTLTEIKDEQQNEIDAIPYTQLLKKQEEITNELKDVSKEIPKESTVYNDTKPEEKVHNDIEEINYSQNASPSPDFSNDGLPENIKIMLDIMESQYSELCNNKTLDLSHTTDEEENTDLIKTSKLDKDLKDNNKKPNLRKRKSKDNIVRSERPKTRR